MSGILTAVGILAVVILLGIRAKVTDNIKSSKQHATK
jgi:hypothetical protein